MVISYTFPVIRDRSIEILYNPFSKRFKFEVNPINWNTLYPRKDRKLHIHIPYVPCKCACMKNLLMIYVKWGEYYEM